MTFSFINTNSIDNAKNKADIVITASQNEKQKADL
jgi:hypothetical protein